ncbi:MAG: hypothetical protein EXR69_05235 [Myxococcales bacterium]|nr:hypothetical protein [Myxococcales bacterium]
MAVDGLAGAARPVRIQTEADAKDVADPRALRRAAEFHKATGNLVLARFLYEKATDNDELVAYLRYGKVIREALVLEQLGDFAAADTLWRENADRDILYTIETLRIASILPARDALVAELVERIKAMAARVKAGEKDVTIYVTSKGEPRPLEWVQDDDVLPRLQAVAAGDESKKLRYCYIEKVDLTGVPSASLPHRLQFGQCIIGSVKIPDVDVGQLVISGVVLGDFDVGKTWQGEVNKSATLPGSRFLEISTRDTIFLGRANFQDVKITGRKAAFPLTVFEGGADFRGAIIPAAADFRYSVFGENANFKRARFQHIGYFGNARFRKETTFTGLYSERELYFNSARFEGPVHFDRCEWLRAATFEDARFDGPVGFIATTIRGRLNMSRAVFATDLDMKEVAFGGMDLFGAKLDGETRFADSRFEGKVRFSLDDATRSRMLANPDPLLSLYRDYQGDEDADAPLTTTSSYGVEHVDDLIAKVRGSISFANSVFTGFLIFDRVIFGTPGTASLADFYNTQFGGETHFERTNWYSAADFTTVYGNELALNEATFHRTLVLDDANVPGRITMTDATFEDGATLSFYGAQIGTLQIDRDQVSDQVSGQQRLWYGRCANGEVPSPESDLRMRRQFLGVEAPSPDDVRRMCYDRVQDEFVSLKQSFGDRAMSNDEDWAYWWFKHVETDALLHFGGVLGVVGFPVRYLLFELAFGWGVRLWNLLVTALLVCMVFAVIYRVWCGDTVMSYNGEDVEYKDIPWLGMFYISLQSLGSFNTGWDFGYSGARFRYLNTLHTFIGLIILTFFVGAYTRMILA